VRGGVCLGWWGSGWCWGGVQMLLGGVWSMMGDGVARSGAWPAHPYGWTGQARARLAGAAAFLPASASYRAMIDDGMRPRAAMASPLR
jgi:hypothetical protein